MISGDQPILLEWEIPLEPPCQPQKVHRLIVEGFELSNALEWSSWSGELGWLLACELCGDPICSGGGAARFRRLEEQLIWMRTEQGDFSQDWEVARPIERQGALHRAAWDRLRRRFSSMPDFEAFPLLCRGDLERLWLAEMPERIRVGTFTELDSLLRGELAASCPLDGKEACRRVRDLFAWFEVAPDDPVAGRLARIDPPEGLHTFIVDRPTYPDWPAFAASDRWTLAFAGGFLYEFPAPPTCRAS
jgi:hypothetical protein